MIDPNCKECEGTGIFWITDEHSQPCSLCNIDGWVELYRKQNEKFTQLKEAFEKSIGEWASEGYSGTAERYQKILDEVKT